MVKSEKQAEVQGMIWSFSFLICTQVATHIADTPPKNGYAGAMATMDVYSFPNIKGGDTTAAVMSISNEPNDRRDTNGIEAGWMVSQQCHCYWTNAIRVCKIIINFTNGRSLMMSLLCRLIHPSMEIVNHTFLLVGRYEINIFLS